MARHFAAVAITEEERREFADSVIICLIRLENLTDAQSEEKFRMKDDRQKLLNEIARLVNILRTGKEIREVEVEEKTPGLPFEVEVEMETEDKPERPN